MQPRLDRRLLDFLLFEWLGVDGRCGSPPFEDHDRETLGAALDLADQIARERFAPLAAIMDEEEPSLDAAGRVRLPEGAAEAIRDLVDGGFLLAGVPVDQGGLGLPLTVAQAAMACFTAANAGLTGYPFLSIANANLLRAFADEAQRRRYLGPLAEGRFMGTMCLSEPQAGSSLADVRTSAVPRDDGCYDLRGTKMWISAGEHELAENIVHLVLARIAGAPPGVRGLSLFIVPRFRVGDDGQVGESNDVALAGLNHKMGYRGTVNTVLSFGEQGACIGELVGPPNEGLRCMFHMMNEARIGVGLGAAVMGCAGYLISLEYARSRPQGRPVDVRDPGSPPVAITAHADVRRMLLKQKALAEGGLALCLHAADLVDRAAVAGAEERGRLEARLDLLTPIVKAWPSEYCLEANKEAIQVLGGYGYTRDYPVERLYRDNRLNPIHEGTNGIQGLDFLGRKVLGDGGEGFGKLLAELGREAASRATDARLGAHARTLQVLLEQAGAAARGAGKRAAAGQTEEALANASDFLEALGHIVVAALWLDRAAVAGRALAGVDREASTGDDFYRGQLAGCDFFFRHVLPDAAPKLARVAAGDRTVLACDPEWL